MSKTKTFVEFYFPGVNLEGKSEREVLSRVPETVTQIPKNAIYYRFFDKDDSGIKTNYSTRYWIGVEYCVDEFKKKYPQLAFDDFLENASRIVKANTGGFYPLLEGDVVLL